MKKMMIVAGLGLCAPFLAHAGNAALASEEASAPAFEQVDTNRDGAISREEASAFSALETGFERVDANRDGKLDAEEFKRSGQEGKAGK